MSRQRLTIIKEDKIIHINDKKKKVNEQING